MYGVVYTQMAQLTELEKELIIGFCAAGGLLLLFLAVIVSLFLFR